MRLALSIALSATLLNPARAADPDANTRLGELFCQLKQGGDDQSVRYLLTKGLLAEIATAEAKNDVIAKAAPDEKPPLGDGVPFQSYPDVAPKCAPDAVAVVDGATQIDIQHAFPDTPNANWTDRIVVRVEDGLAKVDDVLYGTDQYKTGLRKALVDMFQTP